MRVFLRNVIGAAILIAALSQAEAAGCILLRPARVWTADGPVHQGWVVLVTGTAIAAAGPPAAVAAAPGAERTDLPDQTLIPGLTDIHSHLLLHPDSEALRDDPVPYRTLL